MDFQYVFLIFEEGRNFKFNLWSFNSGLSMGLVRISEIVMFLGQYLMSIITVSFKCLNAWNFTKWNKMACLDLLVCFSEHDFMPCILILCMIDCFSKVALSVAFEADLSSLKNWIISFPALAADTYFVPGENSATFVPLLTIYCLGVLPSRNKFQLADILMDMSSA